MPLSRLDIKNFKEVREDTTNFFHITHFCGANGAGKSTRYDALLFCWFGYDSRGQARFGIQPIDRQTEKLIPNLTTDVTVLFNGIEFRRMQKPSKRGDKYTTRTSINGTDSKSLTEYTAYVKSMFGTEEAFRITTDLHYFIETMKWQDRRPILLDLAGNVKLDIKGFPEIVKHLKDTSQTTLDYRRGIQKEIARQEETLADITPRIDELTLKIPETIVEPEGLIKLRGDHESNIANLNKARNKLTETEQARQTLLDKQKDLQSQLNKRESELLTDTSRIADHLAEKRTLSTAGQEEETELSALKLALPPMERELASLQRHSDSLNEDLNDAREEYQANQTPTEAVIPDKHCATCTCASTPELQAEIEAARAKKETDRVELLTKLANQAKDLIGQIKESRIRQAEIGEKITESTGLANEKQQEIDVIKAKAKTRLATLNLLISTDTKVAPADDPTWRSINTQLEALEIGDPVSEQLLAIESQVTSETVVLDELKSQLISYDTTIENQKRIKELQNQADLIAQAMADLEGQLSRLADYTEAEAKETALAVEFAVNSHFSVVKWKLFEQLKNGTYQECCEPTIRGVPWRDASDGERTAMALDTVGTFTDIYDAQSTPLFVDRAESYTGPYPENRQLVKLFVRKDQKTLLVSEGT